MSKWVANFKPSSIGEESMGGMLSSLIVCNTVWYNSPNIDELSGLKKGSKWWYSLGFDKIIWRIWTISAVIAVIEYAKVNDCLLGLWATTEKPINCTISSIISFSGLNLHGDWI